MALYQNMPQLIGNTPLVRLSRIGDFYACRGEIYGKCEFLNPSGSLKDRPSLAIIRKAAVSGALQENGSVICMSGGSAGVSAAMVCACLSIRCAIVAPDSISLRDIRHIRAYGAKIFMSPSHQGLEGIKAKALQIASQNPGSFIMDQFSDPENPAAHKNSTGPEILMDLPDVDFLVAGIGTGGSVTGCGEYIKMHRPECTIIGVEPHDSPVISGGSPGPHSITGIGVGFVPEVLNKYILDKIIRVRTGDALSAARQLALTEGMLCGPSSGAALAAGIFLAQQPQCEGKKIAVILPDRGEEYLDKDIYNRK